MEGESSMNYCMEDVPLFENQFPFFFDYVIWSNISSNVLYMNIKCSIRWSEGQVMYPESLKMGLVLNSIVVKVCLFLLMLHHQ